MQGKKKKTLSLAGQIESVAYKLLLYIVLIFIVIGDTIRLFFTSIYSFFSSLPSFLIIFSVRIIHLFSRTEMKIERKRYANYTKIDFKKITKTYTKPKRSRLDMIQMKMQYFISGLIVASLIVLVQTSYVFIQDLPNPKLIGNVNFPVSTEIYDRNGKLLYELFREQDRTPINIDSLPPYVIHATISIEDKNFYNHKGISPLGGILRAVKETARTGKVQGGSTITQQLIKTSLLSPERTLIRKFREAILAIWTERIYTKKEILQMYLNQVPYGGSAYGIEEAAKSYFNKSSVDLTVSEAALLAGLTRAPSKYSPFVDPKLAKQRRDEVLSNMYQFGYLSKEQYGTAQKQPLNIQPPKTFIRAPHFVFYVKSILEEKYGIRRVEEGGLRVVTSLDLDIQDKAEDVLNEELEKIKNLNVSNGAVLVTSPSTGEILAMVGSKNYFENPFGAYNVTIAKRQPGSSIKPLMYSLALEKEFYTAASIIDDSPVVFQSPGGRPYRPVNYDGRFHGQTPLRYALANSYNVPAVKVLNIVGVQNFVQHAENMGITTWDQPERFGLSLTLGGGEVRMIDMAEAYGIFANSGRKVELNPILSVVDYKGNKLESFTIKSQDNVISSATSFIISDILSDNVARQSAFGSNSDLVIPNHTTAVKTGTTNDKRDNLTYGYTPKFFTGVWVGNNNNAPMNQALTSGITGASPIWNRVMRYVLEKDIKVTSEVQPPLQFGIPLDVVSKTCYFNRIEYFKIGTENKADCKGRLFDLTPTPIMEFN